MKSSQAPAVAKVVVIDDTHELRLLAEIVLTRGGFDTKTAANATEALAAIRAHKPDLVLLDVMMPGISGPEFLAQLRGCADVAGTKVAFMSAIDGPEELPANVQADTVGFICKPFRPSRLAANVRAMLAISPAPVAVPRTQPDRVALPA